MKLPSLPSGHQADPNGELPPGVTMARDGSGRFQFAPRGRYECETVTFSYTLTVSCNGCLEPKHETSAATVTIIVTSPECGEIDGDPCEDQEVREKLKECLKKCGGGTQTLNCGSYDPNDILGPEGVGKEHWIPVVSPLPYTIRYENDAEKANAPAQVVRIEQELDADLDWTQFQLGTIAFGDVVLTAAQGKVAFKDRLDLTNEYGVYLDVWAGLDRATGKVFWELKSIDPETGQVPFSPLAGFLPPNKDGNEGQGFVSYTIPPKKNPQTGDVIDAVATILFDQNEPIDTPAIFNTIDVGAPHSSVHALPDTSAEPTFELNWSGQDDVGGSGIASYDIFMSVNSGPFVPLLLGTKNTSMVFDGDYDHSYTFYSVATDNVGHREPVPAEPDAEITLLSSHQPPVANAGGPYTVDEGGSIQLDASGSSDPDLANDSLTYEWDFDLAVDTDGNGDPTDDVDATGVIPTFAAAALDGPSSVTVGLRVTDEQGQGDTNTTQVTVNNVVPALSSLTATATDEGGMSTLSGIIVDPGMQDTFSVAVDWGDGTPPDFGLVEQAEGTISGSHVYADNGVYTVTVVVWDDDMEGPDISGAMAGVDYVEDKLTIDVKNVSPTIAISGDASVDEGSAYTMTLGSIIDRGNDAVTEYRIHWGDGQQDTIHASDLPASRELTHTYADGPLAPTITVDLVDEDGIHLHAGEYNLSIENVPPQSCIGQIPHRIPVKPLGDKRSMCRPTSPIRDSTTCCQSKISPLLQSTGAMARSRRFQPSLSKKHPDQRVFLPRGPCEDRTATHRAASTRSP